MSENSISPTDWGPYFWYVFHAIIYSYSDPKVVKSFLDNFPYLIPCSICSDHLIELYKSNSYCDLVDDRHKLIAWGIRIHNLVNKSLGKRELSYREADTAFDKGYFAQEQSFDLPKYIIYGVLTVIIIILVVILIKNKYASNMGR